jgi:hypothetical protein
MSLDISDQEVKLDLRIQSNNSKIKPKTPTITKSSVFLSAFCEG